jgi:NADPH:quinone reductase-like Zn-dependent oxidoreductase
VLIKLRAASLNYRDLMVVKGLYNPKLPLPLIPFSDGVGEVVAVGEGVTRVKTGDRVAGIFFQKWLCGERTEVNAKSALGGDLDGLLAEYVVLHEDGVVHVPEHLTDEEVATLPCAAVTAWNALITSGGVKAGDTVLVQGTGGVSIFALQFAQLLGARVIATSSSNKKLERVRQLGASDGINYKETPDWDKQVKELTGGSGIDRVVEVGGAGTLTKSLRAVRIGGQISLIGVLTGGSGEISTAAILMKNVRVQGIYVGSREMFEAMNRAITLHKLRPIVDRVFPFEEVPEALRYMESGAHFGKICVRF